MSGEPDGSSASKLAGSKATLDALLSRANDLRGRLEGACENEGSDLVAALREGDIVLHDLSQCIADFRTCMDAESLGTISFKIHNLPQWPRARFQAWLSRNKVAVQAVEKDPLWRHAIITVDSEKAKVSAMRALRTKSIQGMCLDCGEVADAPPSAQRAHSGPKRGPPNLRTHGTGKAQKLPPPPAPPAYAIPTSKQAPDSKERAGVDAQRIGGAGPQRESHASVTSKESDGEVKDLRDSVAPLWRLSYSEQLKVKQSRCLDALDSLTWELARSTVEVHRPAWLQDAMRECPAGSPCCPLQNILRAPQSHGYRNRADFTIGFDHEAQPVAGHLLGLFREGHTVVAAPDSVPHLSDCAKGYAALMTRFLRSHRCSLPAWNKASDPTTPASDRGFWRTLTIREGRANTFFPAGGPAAPRRSDETLASLDVERYRVPLVATGVPAAATPSERFTLSAEATDSCNLPQEAAPQPEEVAVLVQVNMTNAPPVEAEAELRAWAKFVAEERPTALPAPTSLCWHHSELLGNGIPLNEPIKPVPAWEGSTVGHTDALCELSFSLHPNAFFQVNSAGAALVYHVAGEWAAATSNSCLLDICCGVGTIGLSLAASCAAAVGIDNSKQNITSARSNAAANGVANCTFVLGAAEAKIAEVLQREEVRGAEEVVAIMDPPRGGVHNNLLYALLDCSRLRRLVYVSCNPESLVNDLRVLMTPARAARRRHVAAGKGPAKASAPKAYQPFRPVKACPVDMFPHTRHVEMIVLLER